MKNRKLGLCMYLIGGGLLVVAAVLIIAYFGLKTSDDRELPVLLWSGLAMAAVAVVLLPVGYFISTRPNQELKERFQKYSTLPKTDITDFAAEITAMREAFAAEKDPASNQFFIRPFAGSACVSDFGVLGSGKVVWGCIVQANETLYQNQRIDMLPVPAVILYSPDAYFDVDPLELKCIAERLYKGKEGNFLRNESAFFTNRRLSDAVADGREVYASCIMVYRPHLPLYKATDNLFPVVASPSEQSAFALNLKYWTANFAAYYVHNGSKGRDGIFEV